MAKEATDTSDIAPDQIKGVVQTPVRNKAIPKSMISGKPGNEAEDPLAKHDAMFDRLGIDSYDDDDDDDEEEFEDPSIPQTYELELVTADAQAAWFGKPRTSDDRGFPGIAWFIMRSGKLCRYVREDDPYAMRSALEIEQLLSDIHTNLNTFLSETSRLLDAPSEDGLTFTGVSKERYKKVLVGLEPKNGYALAAARLVGRYDRLALSSHQCRDMSLINSKRFRDMKNRKHFRALTWMLQVALKGTSGATRKDFRDNTGSARNAFEKFGELPEEILDPEFELGLMEVQGPTNLITESQNLDAEPQAKK